jgi:hypothetical protein
VAAPTLALNDDEYGIAPLALTIDDTDSSVKSIKPDSWLASTGIGATVGLHADIESFVMSTARVQSGQTRLHTLRVRLGSASSAHDAVYQGEEDILDVDVGKSTERWWSIGCGEGLLLAVATELNNLNQYVKVASGSYSDDVGDTCWVEPKSDTTAIVHSYYATDNTSAPYFGCRAFSLSISSTTINISSAAVENHHPSKSTGVLDANRRGDLVVLAGSKDLNTKTPLGVTVYEGTNKLGTYFSTTPVFSADAWLTDSDDLYVAMVSATEAAFSYPTTSSRTSVTLWSSSGSGHAFDHPDEDLDPMGISLWADDTDGLFIGVSGWSSGNYDAVGWTSFGL